MFGIELFFKFYGRLIEILSDTIFGIPTLIIQKLVTLITQIGGKVSAPKRMKGPHIK